MEMSRLTTCGLWQDTKIAAASRTEQGPWAHKLLSTFEVAGRPLSELMTQVEIRPGSKITHFENLHKGTGIPYSKMIFFDDSADGKWGNCDSISDLGVLCIHCPRGLTPEVWQFGVKSFAELTAAGETMGRILRPPVTGKVFKYWPDRGYGFAEAADGKEYYFADAMLEGAELGQGSAVSMTLGEDEKYRLQCISVSVLDSGDGPFTIDDGASSDASNEASNDASNDASIVGDDSENSVKRPSKRVRKGGRKYAIDLEVPPDPALAFVTEREEPKPDWEENPQDYISMDIFTMGMPFAALLGRGIKTIETRNGLMFKGTNGRKVLLHVGQRRFDDGDKHRDILELNGMSDDEIDEVTSLPPGFKKGNVVAVMELGRTWRTSFKERGLPDMERNVVAYDEDQGQYATEIRRVQWLQKPLRMRGSAGLWKRTVPRALFPAGWIDVEDEPPDPRWNKKVRKANQKLAKSKAKLAEAEFSDDEDVEQDVVFEM